MAVKEDVIAMQKKYPLRDSDLKQDELYWEDLYELGITVICLDEWRRTLGETLRVLFDTSGQFTFDIFVEGEMSYYRRKQGE